MIIASWDTAQMASTEVDSHLDGFTDSIRRVSNLTNWDIGVAEAFKGGSYQASPDARENTGTFILTLTPP